MPAGLPEPRAALPQPLPEIPQGAFECIDEMVALFGVEAVKAFCRCNVYKYRYRADKKGGATDIAKAKWYMRKLMELEGTDCGLCKDEL